MSQAQVTEQPEVTTRGPGIKTPVLHHYGIITNNVDELVDWYSKVVGIEVNLVTGKSFGDDDDSPYGVWASNDDAHHRIAIIRAAGVKDVPYEERINIPRVQHSAWEYPSVSDLLDSYERIRDLGIHPLVCTHHGMSVAYYYRDPDGNRVELLADAFGDHVKSREYYRTAQELRDNPMGAIVDPEKILAAYKEGASDYDLQHRAYANEFVPDEMPDLRLLI